MTPEENLAQWLAIEARARLGAAAAANAMARYIAERTRDETLGQKAHAPGGYYRAKRGAPPTSASGSLARGMYWRHAAAGGLRATASAGNSARHGRVLEFGCVLTPTSGTHLGWKDTGGIWRHRSVEVTEHPFLGPTTDDAIDDGELQRAAVEAFREYDP